MSDLGCKSRVYPKDRWGAFHPYTCTRKAWKDGFCKTHHPEAYEARRIKSDAKYKAKIDKSPLAVLGRQKNEISELQARITKLETGINDAMMHLRTNYDIDGNTMSDSDAMDCLVTAMQGESH